MRALTLSNRPPVLATIGALRVAEGDSLTVVLSATDADGDPLAYQVAGAPGGTDPLCDLDGDGAVGFGGFFIYADAIMVRAG